jgi:hypothetical protein
MYQSGITNIASADTEVQELLRSWGDKQTFSASEAIKNGPWGRAKFYEHVNSGELPTFLFGGRRFVLAIDLAKFFIALKRQSTTGADPVLSRTARERRLAAIAATRAGTL